MIRIVSHTVPKEGTTSNGGFSNSVVSVNAKIQEHSLWGQPFDGTEDVEGDISNAGNLTMSGTANIGNGANITNDVNITSGHLSADSGVSVSGDVTVTSGCVITPCLSATNATAVNLTANTIVADDIESETIESESILSTSLSAVSAYLQTLISTAITTENLTVTKAAHFFKLIIDEIKATQGQVIVTPANAVIDLVEEQDYTYRCYFRATDGSGKDITNNFEDGDLVVCQTFNVATGTSHNVSNKYYWRAVTGVGRNVTKTIDGVSTLCHFIEMSKGLKDPSSNAIPEAGDNICQLGNNSWEHTDRCAAIIISAYNNQFLDPTISAPSIVQYNGINDFNLSNHRVNVISANLNSLNVNGTLYHHGVEIGSAMTQIEQTLSSVTTTVSAMTVGGTNMLRNSRNMSGTSVLAYGTLEAIGNGFNKVSASAGTTPQQSVVFQTKLEPKTQYTLSFYAKGHGSFQTSEIYLYRDTQAQQIVSGGVIEYASNSQGATSTNERGLITTTIDTDEWQKFWYKWKTKDFSETSATTATTQIVIIARVLSGSNVEIYQCKLEKGNMATDWSPNPLDNDNDFATKTELEVTADGLSSRVSTLENGDWVTGSEFEQTVSSITTSVSGIQREIEIIDMGAAEMVTVDLTDEDEDNMIPVGINFHEGGVEDIRCQVKRTLDYSYGVPDYATHANGFTVLLDWYTKSSGWGTVDVPAHWSTQDTVRYIADFNVSWTENNTQAVCGSIGQDYRGNVEFVYCRGGSKYDILTSKRGATITAYPDGYVRRYDGNHPVLVSFSPIPVSGLVIPVQDTMTRSQIQQTADAIRLSVYNALNERTGIDVETGHITLDADNTTVTGTLNIKGTANGIVLYDQNDIPRLNYHAGNIAGKSSVETLHFNKTLGGSSTKPYGETSVDYTSTIDDNSKIGNFNTGSVIYIDTLYLRALTDSTQVSPVTYTLTLLYLDANDNPVVVQTTSGSANSYTTLNINSAFTVSQQATYYLQVRIQFTAQGGHISVTHQATIGGKVTVVGNSMSEIGLDGISIVQGADKYSYFGPALTELRYGNSGVRLYSGTSATLVPQQYYGTHSEDVWGSIGSVTNLVFNSSGSYNIEGHPEVDTIICTGSGTQVQLSSRYSDGSNSINIPVGRVIYVKGYNSSLTVALGSILPSGNAWGSTTSSLSIGNSFVTCIHCGSGVWVVS